MTSAPGGREPGGLTPSPGARPGSPNLSLRCPRAAVSSFFPEPRVSQRGDGPRVTARPGARVGGRGRGHTAAGPGPRARDLRSPQVHAGPHPTRAGTRLRARAPGHAGAIAPFPVPGRASRPAPTRAASNRLAPTRPHLPGAPQSAQCAFPGRCSSSRTALCRSVAMAARPPPPRGRAGRALRRARAPRRPPAAAAPAPSRAASAGARVPHSWRPPVPAAACVATAAARRVPARSPGRTARSGRHGPRAAPSGAGRRPPPAPQPLHPRDPPGRPPDAHPHPSPKSHLLCTEPPATLLA